MVRQVVMVPHPPAPRTGRMRVLPSSVGRDSLRSPSLRALLARRTYLGDSSGVALAAAASVGWYEVGPITVATGLGPPGGTPIEREEETRAADGGRARLVTCGLWLARRRLVAAVVGPGGGARRVIRAALTDDARFGLVEYLAAAGAELVATEALAHIDLMPRQAARRGLAVWTAGDALVAALLRAAAIRDPSRAAALLARLPVIPLWRSSIRRLLPADERQLPLW